MPLYEEQKNYLAGGINMLGKEDFVVMTEREFKELMARMYVALAQVELVVEGARE